MIVRTFDFVRTVDSHCGEPCDCSQPSLRAVKIRAVFGHVTAVCLTNVVVQVYRKFSGFIARLACFSVPFAAPKAGQVLRLQFVASKDFQISYNYCDSFNLCSYSKGDRETTVCFHAFSAILFFNF